MTIILFKKINKHVKRQLKYVVTLNTTLLS